MSKSFKKTSIVGNLIADSEKKDKKIANRAFRRISNKLIKEYIKQNEFDVIDDVLPIYKEEVCWGNVWKWEKDGKRWIDKNEDIKKLIRK